MAAAVADFRPGDIHPGKQSRHEGSLTLVLHPAPDLLTAAAGNRRDDQLTIGFALEEPEQLLERARSKLQRKGIDALVANPLGTMDSDTIDAMFLQADGTEDIAPAGMAKSAFAGWLLDHVQRLWTRPAPA